jgi:hypothetical protein
MDGYMREEKEDPIQLKIISLTTTFSFLGGHSKFCENFKINLNYRGLRKNSHNLPLYKAISIFLLEKLINYERINLRKVSKLAGSETPISVCPLLQKM